MIRAALKLARPTYITCPTDLVFAEVDAKPLETDLRAEQLDAEADDADDPGKLEAIIESIASLYQKAKNPIILVRPELPDLRLRY